jgi:hypothetical protein
LKQPAAHPPRDLGRHGRQLWDEIQAAYGIADRGGVELLAQACGALDLIEALGEAIARDGSPTWNENIAATMTLLKEAARRRTSSEERDTDVVEPVITGQEPSHFATCQNPPKDHENA